MKEQFVAKNTLGDGSVWDIAFSKDPAAEVPLPRRRRQREDLRHRSAVARDADELRRRRAPARPVLRRAQHRHRLEGQHLHDRDLRRQAPAEVRLQGDGFGHAREPGRGVASFRALILPAALAVATTAAAQTAPAPAPRLEIWGGVVATVTTPSGSLASSYSPPLANDGAFTSSAGQTLNFDAARSAGFEAGVNLFPWPHAGLQVLFDRAKADVSGVNGPYDLSLQYVSIQPPDTTPRPFSYQATLPWPDTTGSLTQSTVGLNAIVRGGRGRVSVVGVGRVELLPPERERAAARVHRLPPRRPLDALLERASSRRRARLCERRRLQRGRRRHAVRSAAASASWRAIATSAGRRST